MRNIVVSSYYSTAKKSLGIDDLPPEVRRGKAVPVGPELIAAAGIYREILEGRGNFESLVQKPFLEHQFDSSFVRAIIQRALEDSGGVYMRAFLLLRIPESRYSVTMQFLKRNNCYLDFRPFRGISREKDDSDL